MTEEPRDHGGALDAEPDTRLGPTALVLIGLVLGVVGGFALAWILGGNPLSGSNRVEFQEVIVNSVSAEADQLCWADDPDRRDSPQTCAILALDPELEVPASGDRVVIGLVEVDTPDGTEFRQVVHVAPAPPREVQDIDDGTGDETDGGDEEPGGG